MTDKQKRMAEMLGIEEVDFKPTEKTDKERIEELEAQNEMLTECLMELADIIYA